MTLRYYEITYKNLLSVGIRAIESTELSIWIYEILHSSVL